MARGRATASRCSSSTGPATTTGRYPKGKCDGGESDEDCALREVQEETGLDCELGEELAATSYRDRHGRPKRVRYWSMRPIGGEFAPIDEVDEVRWLPVDEARELLTYGHDVTVLESLMDLEPTSDEG